MSARPRRGRGDELARDERGRPIAGRILGPPGRLGVPSGPNLERMVNVTSGEPVYPKPDPPCSEGVPGCVFGADEHEHTRAGVNRPPLRARR